MPECIIEIKDEVNVKIHDLDLVTRRQLEKKFKYFLPHAYHVPAYKLGRWDGCVSFFSMGGVTYLNLLDDIIPILNEKYDIKLKDKRKNQTFNFNEVTSTIHNKLAWPKGHTHEGQNIVLRDYQVDVINQFLAEPQCLQEIATGAGKTLITATLSYSVEQYGRSIVIVPNKDLVTQTEDDYKNLGLDCGVYFGDRKDIGKSHTICTWQSLNSMDKRFKDGEIDVGLKTFVKGVVCLIVDEVHMAKADVLRKLLTGPFATIPIRWGLTGTIPQEDWQYASLKVSLGNVINRLSASDLQEQEVLANCEINIIQVQDTVAYPNYQSELTYLTTNEDRMDYLSGLFKNIVKE